MTHPRIVAVGDRAVLVEFADEAGGRAVAQVQAFDRGVGAAGINGVVEVVPSYVSALVVFDPLETDHAEIESSLWPFIMAPAGSEPEPRRHRIQVCYGDDLGPDLAAVAGATGLSVEDVVAAHVGVAHRVVMFGFSPGTAYLSGVAPAIRLPRKSRPVRDVPAGSVIIADQQCLVMTVSMPTGWWVIGRTPDVWTPDRLETDSSIDVGDVVEFESIDRPTFEAAGP